MAETGRDTERSRDRYCSRCGERLVARAAFCSACGVRTSQPSRRPRLAVAVTAIVVMVAAVAAVTGWAARPAPTSPASADPATGPITRQPVPTPPPGFIVERPVTIDGTEPAETSPEPPPPDKEFGTDVGLVDDPSELDLFLIDVWNNCMAALGQAYGGVFSGEFPDPKRRDPYYYLNGPAYRSFPDGTYEDVDVECVADRFGMQGWPHFTRRR